MVVIHFTQHRQHVQILIGLFNEFEEMFDLKAERSKEIAGWGGFGSLNCQNIVVYEVLIEERVIKEAKIPAAQ